MSQICAKCKHSPGWFARELYKSDCWGCDAEMKTDPVTGDKHGFVSCRKMRMKYDVCPYYFPRGIKRKTKV